MPCTQLSAASQHEAARVCLPDVQASLTVSGSRGCDARRLALALQEALTELEAALSERLDASRQEFFGSQEELAQDRNSQIELINGALATIEERLLSDVKAREEEVGLVCERLGIFEPFIYKCDLFTKTGSGQT